MSTLIMSQCWLLQGFSPSQKSVLISLADNANDEGVCWPSVPTIAKRTCLSDRAVQRAIKQLIELKLLGSEQRYGRSTIYTIKAQDYVEKQAQQSLLEEKQPQSESHPSQSDTPDNLTPDPRQSDTPPPSESHLTPDNLSPRTVIEPSKEPKDKKDFCAIDSDEPITRLPDSESKPIEIPEPENPVDQPTEFFTAKGKKLAGENLANFNQFWETYGYKKDRARAADAWLNIRWHKKNETNAADLNRELFVMIIAGAAIERAQRDHKVSANQTPPYAEKWLTARRWEDEDPDLVAQRVALSEEFNSVTHTDTKSARQHIHKVLRDVMNTDW